VSSFGSSAQDLNYGRWPVKASPDAFQKLLLFPSSGTAKPNMRISTERTGLYQWTSDFNYLFLTSHWDKILLHSNRDQALCEWYYRFWPNCRLGETANGYSSMATRLWDKQQENHVGRNFSLLCSIHTQCGSHSAAYTVNTTVSTEVKAATVLTCPLTSTLHKC
jgi:hypothetical protein